MTQTSKKPTNKEKALGGKKFRKALATVEANKVYALADAVKKVQEASKAAGRKFDETLNICVNLGVDPKQSDQNVRGMAQMPAGTGKNVRVVVFAKAEKAEAALKAGADAAGAEELAQKIEGGWQEFDRVIATPDMMGLVGKLGKVLGPRGLMPNPKLGTVTPNVAEAVKSAKAGSVEFRVEKAGIVHAGIGKMSFTPDQLQQNVKAFLDAVVKAKPATVKGTYINKITLSSTMGPGVKVDVNSAAA